MFFGTMPCHGVSTIEAHAAFDPSPEPALDTEIGSFLFDSRYLVGKSGAVKQGPQVFIPMAEIQELVGIIVKREETILAVMA